MVACCSNVERPANPVPNLRARSSTSRWKLLSAEDELRTKLAIAIGRRRVNVLATNQLGGKHHDSMSTNFSHPDASTLIIGLTLET